MKAMLAETLFALVLGKYNKKRGEYNSRGDFCAPWLLAERGSVISSMFGWEQFWLDYNVTRARLWVCYHCVLSMELGCSSLCGSCSRILKIISETTLDWSTCWFTKTYRAWSTEVWSDYNSFGSLSDHRDRTFCVVNYSTLRMDGFHVSQ